MLDNPSQLKAAVLSGWDQYCSPAISSSGAALTPQLRAYVEAFDYTIFGWAHIDEVLNDLKGSAFYAARFGGLLSAPPKGATPAQPQHHESTYIKHLLDVYSEELGRPLNDHGDLPPGDATETDFKRQRERFFEMEHFAHHFRDQSPANTIEAFVEEVYDAVQPVCAKTFAKSSERLNDAMAQAAVLKTTSILDTQAKGRVKQGACHHLANDDRLKWKK